jgi:hypothetical protein
VRSQLRLPAGACGAELSVGLFRRGDFLWGDRKDWYVGEDVVFLRLAGEALQRRAPPRAARIEADDVE